MSECLWTLSQLSSTVSQDVGHDGCSDVCKKGCRDDEQASRIKFGRENTEVEVNQLCVGNWLSTPVKILDGDLRSLLYSTGPI